MIPFSPPRIDDKTVAEVADTLRSGWITTGPKTKEFERRITTYTGAKRTLCVSSATAGMELMLRWFGVGPGDEVIVPAYTYCATANVVVHCGAKPVMVDVNDDFQLDLEAVRAAITPRTKALMPVDIAGFPCDYDGLMALVNDPSIKGLFNASTEAQEKLGRLLILADSAHAFGATYRDKRVGATTDVSVFSFHAVKNLTTAEGGAIVLNLPEAFDHEELYRYLNTMSLHGQSKDALSKTTTGGWRYDVIDAGFKCNMTDLQAAIGLVELERYEEETMPRRKVIFDRYSKAFSELPWAETPVYEDGLRRSSCHVYMLRIPGATEEQRDQLIDHIMAQGVSVNVHFQPLPLLTAYRSRGYKMDDYPNAFRLYASEISLPVYYTLTDEQADMVVSAVTKAVQEVLKVSA